VLSDNDITRIAKRIARSCAPLVVGTFGSYAIGTQREQSDLDLFVIRSATGQHLTGERAIRGILFGVLHPLDIHVFSPEEFEATAYDTLSFAWVIARQARLYYATEDARRLVPSLFSVAEEADAATRSGAFELLEQRRRIVSPRKVDWLPKTFER
jgi:predicted nucleotidyltransferase